MICFTVPCFVALKILYLIFYQAIVEFIKSKSESTEQCDAVPMELDNVFGMLFFWRRKKKEAVFNLHLTLNLCTQM